ncbi:6062_t:CDS:2 [Rhizophagus irregularis]|nr:6062_t:CDS:2 [Rhizophagus irregularis]
MKRSPETPDQRDAWLSREQNNNDHINRQNENQNRDAVNQQLSETDRELLYKFQTEMNKLKHTFCFKCNERFPSVELIKGEYCRRCHSDNRKVNNTGNNTLKKFSADNNMDLGEVPEELKGLTEIEEMLIAQIFPIALCIIYPKTDLCYEEILGKDFHLRNESLNLTTDSVDNVPLNLTTGLADNVCSLNLTTGIYNGSIGVILRVLDESLVTHEDVDVLKKYNVEKFMEIFKCNKQVVEDMFIRYGTSKNYV